MQLDNFYTIKDIVAKTGKTYHQVVQHLSKLKLHGRYYKKHKVYTQEQFDFACANIPVKVGIPEDKVYLKDLIGILGYTNKISVEKLIAKARVPFEYIKDNGITYRVIERKYIQKLLDAKPKRKQNAEPRQKEQKDVKKKVTGKTYYRVSVKDFDGKYYVKSAGLTRQEAELEVELYRQQYLKAVAIPCRGV